MSLFIKKVKWIKAFYYFYMFIFWGIVLSVVSFLGWQGYEYLTSDVFLVDAPYQLEFRLIEPPVLPYLDFDEFLLEWRSEFFENYAPFYIYNTSVLQRQLRGINFIDSFTVEKRYPDSLMVRYSVREPMMGISLKNDHEEQVYLIDQNGRVLLSADQALIQYIPRFMSSSAYTFSQSGWRGHNGIRFCLDLLARIREDSRMENIYWQMYGIRFEAPDKFDIRLRNNGEFSVYAQTMDEIIGVLRKNSHDLAGLNGKNIIIRGEAE